MATKKYINLSNLSTFLSSLKETFAAISHKHTISDFTDFAIDSELSSTSTNPVQNKVIDAEFDAIAVSMNALESAIDAKSDDSHTHNDIYYTETEIDNMEFITINDIDTICGANIQYASINEVTF